MPEEEDGGPLPVVCAEPLVFFAMDQRNHPGTWAVGFAAATAAAAAAAAAVVVDIVLALSPPSIKHLT